MRLPLLLLTGLIAPCEKLTAQTCPAGLTYIGLDGRDTLAIEQVAFTSTEFRSVARAVDQGALLHYFGTFAPDGLVRSVTVDVWRQVADSAIAPSQHAIVTFEGREAIAVVSAPSRGTQTQRDSVPEGSLPYMTGTTVFLELLIRRAQRFKAQMVAIPILWLFTGGALDTARVQKTGADSITIALSKTTMGGRVDRNGRLLRLHDEKTWALRQLGCAAP